MAEPEPHKAVLERIASSNSTPSRGPGFDPRGLVPAFTINNRAVADGLQYRLAEQNIVVSCQKSRLITQFFVAADQLGRSLELRDQYLATHPDIMPRKFSRDYDSLFLMSPVLIVATMTAFFMPGVPRYVWLAVLVTGGSAIAALERINRQYRYHVGSQWSLNDLFWAMTIGAGNVALWTAVL